MRRVISHYKKFTFGKKKSFPMLHLLFHKVSKYLDPVTNWGLNFDIYFAFFYYFFKFWQFHFRNALCQHFKIRVGQSPSFLGLATNNMHRHNAKIISLGLGASFLPFKNILLVVMQLAHHLFYLLQINLTNFTTNHGHLL